jgi:hypothetical protein
VPLAWHGGPPWKPKAYLRVDHFSGGGSSWSDPLRLDESGSEDEVG